MSRKCISKLYGGFVGDLFLYTAPTIGLFAGAIASVAFPLPGGEFKMISYTLIGLGIGLLVKTFVMFPNFEQAPETDILTLMGDPYASPLRAQPAKLKGELIGRGDAGYAFGSDLKLQDPSGLLFLRYASRFGPIGNALFGMKKVNSLIGMQVHSLGWFRRGVAPWMDLIQLESQNETKVNSYHRFGSFVTSGVMIIVGIGLLFIV
ncbi:hypothetical protein [Laspinema olomoucense]|uniref:hypothetical protein n=1 Tax=Laspinema olomoucense TaxID=3231600 RepID=UPI0021BB00D9|nr:hypothetical protein [Laspinema sp. D3a]MCT7990463.1 hypothetical protein [Laspinema sp. D3a]